MPTPDRSRDVRRRELGETSGRQAGRSYFAIQFGSDELGPEDLRFALTGRGLHIQRQKGMKDVVGQEGYQQKALDGAGVMFEDMIGVPFVDQFVEGIVLDVPSLVPQMDHAPNRNLISR